MKKQIATLLCVSLMMNMLVGCGGEYTGMLENDPVSGGVVSGEAVSGQAVETISKTETSHQFCTDTNLYSDTDDGEIVQMRLDGSHKKKMKLDDLYDIIRVEADYLYYERLTFDEDDGPVYYAICRVPIRKDEDGFDVVETEQVEELVADSEEEISCWGMNSKYIFYTHGDYQQLIQYDRKTGKKIRADILSEMGDDLYGVCGSRVFAFPKNGIYVKEEDETKWTQISDRKMGFEDIELCDLNEKAFYYTMEEDADKNPTAVRICDVTRAKKNSSVDREFVGKKQLIQGVAEAKGLHPGKVKSCGITNLFCEGDRLYLQVEIGWKNQSWYQIETLMFSQGREEAELRYEKTLTECMKSHAKTRTGVLAYYTYSKNDKNDRVRKWHVPEEKAKAEMVWCYQIVNAKAFLSFWDEEKGKGRVGCFELETGKFRWLNDTDQEFYEPCYEDGIVTDDIDDYYDAELAFYDSFAIYQEGVFYDK
ncbi:MAG: hypothetical protein PUC49_09580 [Clostridiales bacterium]|nr:hypothetical protein [Clostridiales bacterium]